jgi:hypothetical protein
LQRVGHIIHPLILLFSTQKNECFLLGFMLLFLSAESSTNVSNSTVAHCREYGGLSLALEMVRMTLALSSNLPKDQFAACTTDLLLSLHEGFHPGAHIPAIPYRTRRNSTSESDGCNSHNEMCGL